MRTVGRRVRPALLFLHERTGLSGKFLVSGRGPHEMVADCLILILASLPSCFLGARLPVVSVSRGLILDGCLADDLRLVDLLLSDRRRLYPATGPGSRADRFAGRGLSL
jgi:hypothetical protein